MVVLPIPLSGSRQKDLGYMVLCRINPFICYKMPNDTASANKHHTGCEAQLAWKCRFMPTFAVAILTHTLGQTGLVFGMRSGFISRSMHARLQISMCSGYGLFQPCYHPDRHTHPHRQTDSISASWAKHLFNWTAKHLLAVTTENTINMLKYCTWL